VSSTLLPVRAWRDSRLYPASENSGPSGHSWPAGVPMGVGAKIVCSETSDTIVQYAACLTQSSPWVKWGEYNSILIILARQAVQLLFFPRKCAPAPCRPPKFKDTTDEAANTALSRTLRTTNTLPKPYFFGLGLPSTSSYIMSVRNVYFVPFITSSPAWRRSRCWNSSTLPHLGTTSSRRSLLYE
jgi:hypothetical protein